MLGLVAVVGFSGHSYVRSTTATGMLVPTEGLLQLRAPVAGFVSVIPVQSGDLLSEGDPVLILNRDLAARPEQGAATTSLAEKRSRLRHLQEQKRLAERRYATQRLSRGLQFKQHGVSTTFLKAQRALGERSLMGLREQHERLLALAEQGFLPLIQVSQSEQKMLVAETEQVALRARIRDTELVARSAQAEINLLALEFEQRQLAFDSEISALNEEIARAETDQEVWVRAHRTGRVDAIRVSEGEFVAAHTALATLLPQHTTLVAEMLVPTAAALQVKSGQRVHLKYDALPFQKHGVFKATINHITAAAVPQQRSMSTDGLVRGFFRLRAELDLQQIESYGEVVPLKPGMTFNADLVLERRSLADWVLDPLRAVAPPIASALR